jgi:hypothetical protein
VSVELAAVQEFVVTAAYPWNRVVLTVSAGGTPVARLVKDGHSDSAKPYRIFGGPGLDRLDGLLGGPVAYGPDGTALGRVDSSSRLLRGGHRWTVEQTGLGTLTGEAVGVSGLRYRWPQSMVLTSGPADSVLPFRLRFTGDGSSRFTVHRPAGVRARFEVEVHDARAGRRVVLAAVAELNRSESGDPRQEISDLVGNPFDRWPLVW